MELTRGAIALALDWQDLPENEREQFKEAIAARAAVWRAPGAGSERMPAVWPIVVDVRQDPSV